MAWAQLEMLNELIEVKQLKAQMDRVVNGSAYRIQRVADSPTVLTQNVVT